MVVNLSEVKGRDLLSRYSWSPTGSLVPHGQFGPTMTSLIPMTSCGYRTWSVAAMSGPSLTADSRAVGSHLLSDTEMCCRVPADGLLGSFRTFTYLTSDCLCMRTVNQLWQCSTI